MRGLSFRYRLLLAMMLVVGGVSAVTFFITQKRVQTAYDGLFEQLVQAEISYQPRAQEARLSNVRRQCARLASSVRLLAVLGEDPIDTYSLYDTANHELRNILQGDSEEGGLAEGMSPEPEKRKIRPSTDFKTVIMGRRARQRLAVRRQAAKQSVAELFRFIDYEGNLLKPDEETAEELKIKWLDQPDLEQQLAAIGRSLTNLNSQQVGYVYFEPKKKSQPKVLEIVVTPIIDDLDGSTVGALIVGMPYMNFSEQTINELGDIQNGLWLNNRLHTSTIDESIRDDLSVQLVYAFAQDSFAEGNPMYVHKGKIPQRVFHTPLNPESMLPHAYKVGLYSMEAAIDAERELRTQILMISALAIIVALLFSLLLSHGLSVPIHKLVAGTEAIRKGDFNVKVASTTHDEIGQLARSFNEMASDLALKEKYHNLLNMVTDRDVAAELMGGNVALGGEKREVSVLFCDIRGFTALTQGMDPHDVILMLNEHMTALAEVVARHRGVVDKFVGDEIMAVFGAPKSYGDDIANAVKAGLEMIGERDKLNETSKYKIQIGIGIATGEAVAGNMGSANRLNYTVLGERVNLGARLCGVAGKGEVVIDETTEERLGERAETKPMDLLQLKGFSDEIKAFHVNGVRF